MSFIRTILWALCIWLGFLGYAKGEKSAGAPKGGPGLLTREEEAALQSQATHNPMVDDDDGIFQPEAEPDFSKRVATSPSGIMRKQQQLQQQTTASAGFPKFLTPHHVFKPSAPDSVKEAPNPMHLSYMLKKFKFKGYGVSLSKSLTTWSQLGLGVRIPVTANFPDYDCHTELPRIGALSGVWWELGTGFYSRTSISIAFPLRMAAVIAAALGSTIGFVPDALVARIRNRKAADSIRRVGFTVSLRYVPYGPKRGMCVTIGPWLFYVPGLKFMSQVLPFVFFFPAVFMALLNMFLDMDAVSARFLPPPENENESGAAADYAAPSASQIPPRLPQQSQQSQQNASEQNIVRTSRRGQGVRYWHSAWLDWCATKTAGLGLNTIENFNFKSKRSERANMNMDIDLGMSVLLDIAPFFPFGQSVALPPISRICARLWDKVVNSAFDPLKLDRGKLGGGGKEENEDEAAPPGLKKLRKRKGKVQARKDIMSA